MHVETGSILTENQLKCNRQTVNNVPLNLFKYTRKLQYLKIKQFINTLVNTQVYVNTYLITIVFKYFPTLRIRTLERVLKI